LEGPCTKEGLCRPSTTPVISTLFPDDVTFFRWTDFATIQKSHVLDHTHYLLFEDFQVVNHLTYCYHRTVYHTVFDADIDECATINGGCSDNADCTNNHGSFTCTCLPGYTGDGFTCAGDQEHFVMSYPKTA